VNIVSLSQTSASAPTHQGRTQRQGHLALCESRPLQHHSQRVGDMEAQMLHARRSLRGEPRILRKRRERFETGRCV
jgi:hypothetical protein